MFATGSHDGGVRIWSNQPSEGIAIEEAPSRATSTHPAPTPRTASPSLYDMDYRTESPAANTESNGGTPATGSQADLLSPDHERNRSVTFHEPS